MVKLGLNPNGVGEGIKMNDPPKLSSSMLIQMRIQRILRKAEFDLNRALGKRSGKELPPDKARLDNAQSLLECISDIHDELANHVKTQGELVEAMENIAQRHTALEMIDLAIQELKTPFDSDPHQLGEMPVLQSPKNKVE